MARVWVKDYPEAPGRAALYKKIASQLSEQKKALKNSLNIPTPNLSNLSTGGIQQGSYYDVYDGKTYEWVGKIKNMYDDLNWFSGELSNRIDNANELAAMWTSRIPLGHWEG